MIEVISEWARWVWEAFGSEDTRDRTNAIVGVVMAILALSAVAWAIIKFLVAPFFRSKPDKPKPPIGADHNILTKETLDELLEGRIEKRLAEQATTHGDERSKLQSEIDALKKQRRNLDAVLEETKSTNKDLLETLTREGNSIGADKLEAARAALATGDYSAADNLFAEIEARDALAVQSAARAAYARGEIAEAEVRWADAAEHYARAAAYDQTVESLRKAADFAERSGDYPAALRFGELALEKARAGNDQLFLGQALNEHALTL